MSSTVTVIVTTVLNIGTPSSYKNKNHSIDQHGLTEIVNCNNSKNAVSANTETALCLKILAIY